MITKSRKPMNDNQLITKESEWIAYFTSSIERIIAKMERMKNNLIFADPGNA